MPATFLLQACLLITFTFFANLLLLNLVEGCWQDHGWQATGTEVGIVKSLHQEKRTRPGAKGKGVVFVLVVFSFRCEAISIFLRIPLIEHIVVDNFSPVMGRILVRVDHAGQGCRFQVVWHLKPITRLKKRLLGERRREMQGWVYLGDGEGVVLEEGVSSQQIGFRRGERVSALPR